MTAATQIVSAPSTMVSAPRERTGGTPEPAWLGGVTGFFALMEEVFREARADARKARRQLPHLEW